MARALGALLKLSPDAPPLLPPRPTVGPVPAPGADAAAAARGHAGPLLWAPDPALDGPAAAGGRDQTLPWAPDPVLDRPATAVAGSEPEKEAEVGASAAALQEAGFGGPLHTALGELRRISDDDLPPAEPRVHQEPSPPPRSSLSDHRRAGPRVWGAALGEWWGARWREVLPVLVVAALVVMAFSVVLATGRKHATGSRVDTSPSSTEATITTLGDINAALLPPDTTPPDTAMAPGSPSAPAASHPTRAAQKDGKAAASPPAAPGPAPSRAVRPPASPAPPSPAPASPAPAPASTAPATTAKTTPTTTATTRATMTVPPVASVPWKATPGAPACQSTGSCP